MRKVYVIQYEDYCESSSDDYISGTTGVYDSQEKAREKLKQIIEDEKFELDYEENEKDIELKVEDNWVSFDLGWRFIKYEIKEYEVE